MSELDAAAIARMRLGTLKKLELAHRRAAYDIGNEWFINNGDTVIGGPADVPEHVKAAHADHVGWAATYQRMQDMQAVKGR